jgi:hypothetical protein
MDKIPCTGNDVTGNQYRVTGGIRLWYSWQYTKKSKFQNFTKLQKNSKISYIKFQKISKL